MRRGRCNPKRLELFHGVTVHLGVNIRGGHSNHGGHFFQGIVCGSIRLRSFKGVEAQ